MKKKSVRKISKKKLPVPKMTTRSTELISEELFDDIHALIESRRNHIAQALRTELVKLYWSIGDRIRRKLLKEKRAGYGKENVQTLSGKLSMEYGRRGYSKSNIFNMIRLSEVFPEPKIFQTLSGKLGWSHFLEIIYLSDDLQRDFYAEMCRIGHWSVRELRENINSMLFERTALSRKPAKLVKQELQKLRDESELTPDLVFREPYLLDFLGMQDTYSEKDFESAIIRNMENVLMEFGDGFTFVARQKRIRIGNQDYYLDLLFFHRKLRRMVAVELKIGKFQAADKGQMELYLRWLEKHEKQKDEETPLGLILCADKSDEHIELLQLEKSGIRVATYLTGLPPRSLLQKKLQEAIVQAREKYPSEGEQLEI